MNAALATARLPALLAGFAAAPPDVAVTGVALDSREVVPGGLFLAARGGGRHGLAFAGEALQRGAAAIAWEPAAGIEMSQWPVPNCAVAGLGAHAGEIAARFHRHPSRELFTVGITGTDGKTSTAHLLAQAFDRLGRRSVYFGTLGYGELGALHSASHTTPDAARLQALLAAARDAGSQTCAMEVSSHALDQARVAGVEFDLAMLTNVGRDHLDYHGSREDYAAAKRRLFSAPDLKAAVLNRDDAYGAAWARELVANQSVTTYGLGDGEKIAGARQLIGLDLDLHAAGLRLEIRGDWGAARIDSPLLGRFNACNLLAALAALLHAGVPLPEAAAALGAARTVPGRIEAFRDPRAVPSTRPLVVVDYAHTPQALAAALDALRAHTQGKLICVFGCGGDRDRGKRPLMGAATAARAEVLILTDDNPRSESPAAIVAEILGGISTDLRSKVTVEHDRGRAIADAVSRARADDVVLVAGKGHEDYQIYGSERRAFSDRAFVADLLGMDLRA